MAKNITLGIIQTDTEVDEVKKNVEKGIELVAQAAQKGAQLVLMPELFTTGYNPVLLGRRYADLAEKKDGWSVSMFRQAAKENNVYVQVGYVESRGVPGVVYNSVMFIGPDGELIDSYAKAHLFAGERLYFSKGDVFPYYDTDFGRVAAAVCYDIAFPEYGRIQALQGTELILCSSAWRIQDYDIWQNNCAARATDNLYFVAGCNRVGHEADLHLFGESRIVAPRGNLVVKAPMDEECILVHTIDLDDVREARKECLYMIDRRVDLYGPLTKPASLWLAE